MPEVRIVLKIPGDSPLGEVLGPMRNRAAITRDALVFYLTATGRLGGRPLAPAERTINHAAEAHGVAVDPDGSHDAEWARKVGGFDLRGLGGGD